MLIFNMRFTFKKPCLKIFLEIILFLFTIIILFREEKEYLVQLVPWDKKVTLEGMDFLDSQEGQVSRESQDLVEKTGQQDWRDREDYQG